MILTHASIYRRYLTALFDFGSSNFRGRLIFKSFDIFRSGGSWKAIPKYCGEIDTLLASILWPVYKEYLISIFKLNNVG